MMRVLLALLGLRWHEQHEQVGCGFLGRTGPVAGRDIALASAHDATTRPRKQQQFEAMQSNRSAERYTAAVGCTALLGRVC